MAEGIWTMLAVFAGVGVLTSLFLLTVTGLTRSSTPRLRAIFARTDLRSVFAAWALLHLAAAQWTMSASGTVSLDQVGPPDLLRAAFLGTSLLVGSLWLVTYGAPSLAALHRTPIVWFTAFGVWSALTVLWTTSLPATAYKTTEYLATLFLVAIASFAIGRSPTPELRWSGLKRLFDWHWVLFTMSLVGVGIGVVLWPDLALGPGQAWVPWQLRGVFPTVSSNGVGELGALLSLVCANRLLARRRRPGPYLALGAVALLALVLAQSRSAHLGFALGLIVLLVHHRAWRWFFWAGAAGVVVLSTQLLDFVVAYVIRGRPTTLATLTGRTTWWDAAFDAMRERPLEGFGAFTGGKFVLRDAFDLGTSTLHNSFVEAWAGTGTVGLLLFTAAIVAMAWALVRWRPVAKVLPMQHLLWGETASVFALLLVRSVFSVSFLWPPMMSSAILLVFLASYRSLGSVDRSAVEPPRQVSVDQRLELEGVVPESGA